MRRLIGTAAVLSAMIAAGLAFGQTFSPPPGVKMGINLYPETKFRGYPEVLTKDTPRLARPVDTQSLVILRGVWQLCSDINYGGRCQTVDATRQGIPIAITVRSARLVGDQGPGYVPPAMANNKPAETPHQMAAEAAAAAAPPPPPPPRPAPAPAIAPEVAQGGVPGTNPSLRGVGVEFFPAPARAGLRILACSQGPLNARCVQATSDTFCAEHGYIDSSNSGTENVAGRAYLDNVLCKSTPDAGSTAGTATPPAKKKKKRLLGL